MSRIGRFDTDSEALRARIGAHERYSTGDMTGWALGVLGAQAGERVLDLGAGTGEQSLRLLGGRARVVAVDASGESLHELRDAAEAGADLETVQGRFDDLVGRQCGGSFHRAISCYALYYADDPRRLLERVIELLEPGATLFVCGPAFANNAELRGFHYDLDGSAPAGPTPAATFMEQTLPALCDELLGGHERHEFENWLRFDTAEALVAYWSAYNLYDPALAERFAVAADEHLATNDTFATAKRVVGVRAETAA